MDTSAPVGTAVRGRFHLRCLDWFRRERHGMEYERCVRKDIDSSITRPHARIHVWCTFYGMRTLTRLTFTVEYADEKLDML